MSVMSTRTIITRICWIAINLSCLTTALKDVYVTVPPAVKRGDNITLTCRYDLEEDNLYSIKWYKGKREFYRYTPRENPPMKVFKVAGINVERSMSNSSNVLLTKVEPGISGKYSCEVSADAPSFHTIIVSGDMEVIELPSSGPQINGTDRIYSIGDILTANCSLSRTKPPANLTWLINNYPVPPYQIVPYSEYKNSKDELLNLETAVLGIKLVLTPKHFRSKHLRLACKAKIYEIYEEVAERIVELDPSTNLILVDDFSTIGNSRHTLYDSANGNEQHDIQMHHIQADMSASSSSSSSAGFSTFSAHRYLMNTIKWLDGTFFRSRQQNRVKFPSVDCCSFHQFGVFFISVAITMINSPIRLIKTS